MRELGICKNSSRLYEGNRNSGSPVINHAPLLPIDFIGIDKPHTLKEFDGYKGHVFRELSFDPITKVRRGIVYKLNENQPVTWRVHDPSRKDIELSSWGSGGAQKLDAIGYNSDSLAYLRELKKFPRVVLGESPYQSYWKILSIETLFNSQSLVTLKAMSSFGTVPELIVEKVPENAKSLLTTSLDNTESSANRLGAIETVDACRSTLSIVFGALAGNLTLDLGAGIRKRIDANLKSNPKGNGQDLITFNAEIVRRLHSRAKPNEMVKLSTRPISDEDACLALNCLWFILIELRWAKND